MGRSITYHWDLLSCLVQRDIKIHYRRTLLGILWAQASPLLSLLIFTFVFQKLVPLNIPNYSAYVFIGLLAWTWFSNCLNMANYSLHQSRDLVRKPDFNTEMIVVVSITTNLVNYILALPVLFGLLLWNGLVPNWTLIFFPLIVLIQFCFTLGLSLLISSSTIFFRDLLHISGFIVSIWFYVTPVFYQFSPNSQYQFVINLNPMTHIILAYRRILIEGQPPDFAGTVGVAILALVILGLGLGLFGRLKYYFVDEL